MDKFWEIYWICVCLYLALSIITYKLESVVYGEVSEEQIGAFISLFIISFIPVINVILVVFFITGLFIKIMIVIEDIFDGNTKIN